MNVADFCKMGMYAHRHTNSALARKCHEDRSFVVARKQVQRVYEVIAVAAKNKQLKKSW